MATCEDIANQITGLDKDLDSMKDDLPNRTDRAKALAEIHKLYQLIEQKKEELTNCLKQIPGYEINVEIFDLQALPGAVARPGEGTIWKLLSLGQLSVETRAIQDNRVKFNHPDSIIGTSIGITIEDSPNVLFRGPMFRSGPYGALPPLAPTVPTAPPGRIQIIVAPATLLTLTELKAKLPSVPLCNYADA